MEFANDTQERIDALKFKILTEAIFIDIRPYSHNIVGHRLKELKDLCKGTNYLDTYLLSTPLPIMGWKHLLSDINYLTPPVLEKMKKQERGWRQMGVDAMQPYSESEYDSDFEGLPRED